MASGIWECSTGVVVTLVPQRLANATQQDIAIAPKRMTAGTVMTMCLSMWVIPFRGISNCSTIVQGTICGTRWHGPQQVVHSSLSLERQIMVAKWLECCTRVGLRTTGQTGATFPDRTFAFGIYGWLMMTGKESTSIGLSVSPIRGQHSTAPKVRSE